MKEGSLDFVLVPLGLIVMVAYHLWLLRRIKYHPTRTVIGINAISRRKWVQAMMEDPVKNGVLAVQTLRNNIMASTLLASTAIMLCSIIAVLSNNNNSGSGSPLRSRFIYGDISQLGLSVKLFAILVCFLLAFLLTVQSIRYYSHAGVLINVPTRGPPPTKNLAADYVSRTLNRGGYFWSLGLRAYYFSFPLFLWMFGPIPMVTSCFILVFVLYFLDSYADWDDDASADLLFCKKGENENGAVGIP